MKGISKNKKVILGAVLCVVVLAVVIGGIILFRHGKSSNDEIVYVNSVKSIMDPGSASGSLNRFAGVVESQKTVKIPQNTEKTVKQIFVEEGQEVTKGTVLFVYDTEETAENLEKAKLEYERIENEIENKKNEIALLEKEKKKAGSDEQLDYTIQIQSAQLDLKQSEYSLQSKQVEIDKLEDALDNAEVTSEIDGVIKSINDGSSESYGYGESNDFMTIVAMGDFRIKGKINEQNMGAIMSGQPVIIHSRVDESVTWSGTMGEIDMENPGNDNNNYYYYGSDSMSQSNSYPFYVDLNSSEGLMLGQHVYIEVDYGQEEVKEGIWLDEYYICDIEDSPYVWADNGKGKLEKRSVTLGEYDENLYRYEIKDGLTEDDLITFPEDQLEEGMATAKGENGQMGYQGPVDEEMNDDLTGDEYLDENMMGDENLMGDDSMMEGMPEDGLKGEIIGGSSDDSMDGATGGLLDDALDDGEMEDEQ